MVVVTAMICVTVLGSVYMLSHIHITTTHITPQKVVPVMSQEELAIAQQELDDLLAKEKIPSADELVQEMKRMLEVDE